MCNNYGLLTSVTDLLDVFQDHIDQWVFDGPAPNLQPTDDIRPTDVAPVVIQTDGGATLTRLKWGLIPRQPKRPPVINFRSEGRAFESGRCLVPASSFFEFTGTKSPKTRWRFTRDDGDWFCFAGLVTGAAEDRRFTLLTTSPGPDIAPIHDRQPVVIERDGWNGWLTGEPAEPLLVASQAGTWRYAEAPREGVAKPEPAQGSLF
jgi:putative SOS response-associated peptidase YedK